MGRPFVLNCFSHRPTRKTSSPRSPCLSVTRVNEDKQVSTGASSYALLRRLMDDVFSPSRSHSALGGGQHL